MAAPPIVSIAISPRRVVGVLVFVDCLLLAVHVAVQWMVHHGSRTIEAAGLVDMDAEISVPTWWAQSKLLLGAALAVAIGALLKRPAAPDHRYWTVLGLIFVFVSVDEGSEIHERFIEPLRDLFGVTGGIFWYAWLIPGIALVLLFGLVFFRFWWRTPPRVRTSLALAGGLFLAGAVGIEMVGSAYLSDGERDYGYALITGAEEFLELVGTSLFVGALLAMILHVAQTRPFAARVTDVDANADPAASQEHQPDAVNGGGGRPLVREERG